MAVHFQERFSETHAAEMFDLESRRQKAAKVLAVLDDYLGDMSGLSLLDVGCSNGMMTRFYGERFKDVVGVDIDEPGVTYALVHNGAPNIKYRLIKGMDLGQPDASVDVVTCTHVYEHVPDQARLMDEIHRVLKPSGVCLFIAGNRLALMEADNHLPLLSVLPRPLAHRYLRVMGKGDHYYETTRTVWGLRKLVSRFEIHDYTDRVLREPERFAATDLVRAGSLKQRAAVAMLRLAYWISPTFIWVLTKKS